MTTQNVPNIADFDFDDYDELGLHGVRAESFDSLCSIGSDEWLSFLSDTPKVGSNADSDFHTPTTIKAAGSDSCAPRKVYETPITYPQGSIIDPKTDSVSRSEPSVSKPVPPKATAGIDPIIETEAAWVPVVSEAVFSYSEEYGYRSEYAGKNAAELTESLCTTGSHLLLYSLR